MPVTAHTSFTLTTSMHHKRKKRERQTGGCHMKKAKCMKVWMFIGCTVKHTTSSSAALRPKSRLSHSWTFPSESLSCLDRCGYSTGSLQRIPFFWCGARVKMMTTLNTYNRGKHLLGHCSSEQHRHQLVILLDLFWIISAQKRSEEQGCWLHL